MGQRPGKRPLQKASRGSDETPGSGVRPRRHAGTRAGWPNQRAAPLGALALTESLPVLSAQRTVPAAGDIAVQAPRFGLHADHFGARNGQGVGVALLLQPEPQVGAVSVDGIGDHPADRQASRLRSWHHAQSQFRFGLKGDGLREVSGSPAREIVAPVFGQIPFAVDQGMRKAPSRRRGRRPPGHFRRAQWPRNTASGRQPICGHVWGSHFHPGQGRGRGLRAQHTQARSGAGSKLGRQRSAVHRAPQLHPRPLARASVACQRAVPAWHVQRSASYFFAGSHSRWLAERAGRADVVRDERRREPGADAIASRSVPILRSL